MGARPPGGSLPPPHAAMAGAALWVHFASEAPLGGSVGCRRVPSNGEQSESLTVVKRASDGETKAQRGSDGLSRLLTQPHTHPLHMEAFQ